MNGSPPSADFWNTVERIRRLRLAGPPGAAIRVATQALGAHGQQPALVAEVVRVLVAAGQGETAARLYQTLDAAAQQEVGPEPEVLVRLALLLGRRDLTEGMPAEGKTGWLGHFLREGEDPLAEMIWRGVQVKVRSGPADIIMPGACPHCGHEAAVHFPISLVVSREALCGACFGRQAIHWAGIEAYLEDTRADFLTLDVRETDWDLIDAVRPLLQPGSDAPEVVQNLGQEYQFLLNEILAGHLLSGGGGAAGTERP